MFKLVDNSVDKLWNTMCITPYHLKDLIKTEKLFTLFPHSFTENPTELSIPQSLDFSGFEAVINLFTAPNNTEAELISYHTTQRAHAERFPHTLSNPQTSICMPRTARRQQRKEIHSHEDHLYKKQSVQRSQYRIKGSSVQNDNAYSGVYSDRCVYRCNQTDS